MLPCFLELNAKIPAFTSSFNASTVDGTFLSMMDAAFVADNERFVPLCL
jgi:hypothetical protein